MNEPFELISLQARRDAQTLLAGRHISSKLGEGYDFAELRAYQSGDEVRKIAWNVSARRGELYVKEMDETRRLNVVVAAMADGAVFCAADNAKQRLIGRIAATLGYAAVYGGDTFQGAALLPQKTTVYEPSREYFNVETLSEKLLSASLLHTQLQVDDALRRLFDAIAEPSLVILVGDFLQPVDLALLSQRHDVVAVIVRCETEAFGTYLTGEKRLYNPLTGSVKERYVSHGSVRAYLRKIREHDDALYAHFAAHRIRHTTVTAHEHMLERLMRLFS
jgi:uncharacterized protein (DUF58 family)